MIKKSADRNSKEKIIVCDSVSAVYFGGNAVFVQKHNRRTEDNIMTINEILSQVDSEKPNEYATEQKLIWLNEAESAVYVDLRGEVYDSPVTANSPQTAVLSVPEPYAKMYTAYVKAQIDAANEDYDSYNQNIAVYNTYYQRYADYLVRHGRQAWNFRNFM